MKPEAGNIASINLDLSPRDRLTVDAEVLTWNPLHLEVRAWNARLAWYELLMENKYCRGELDAFATNANEYMALADRLTSQAVAGVLYRQQLQQKKISKSATAIIIASTALYCWLPWLGIAIDVAGILAMLIWCYRLELRNRMLCDFLEARQQNVHDRRRQFRETRLAWYSMLSGVKNA